MTEQPLFSSPDTLFSIWSIVPVSFITELNWTNRIIHLQIHFRRIVCHQHFYLFTESYFLLSIDILVLFGCQFIFSWGLLLFFLNSFMFICILFEFIEHTYNCSFEFFVCNLTYMALIRYHYYRISNYEGGCKYFLVSFKISFCFCFIL